MTCAEIIKEIETWAPKEIAWQKDNTGLQVGSLARKVNGIMLCLELTDKVLAEALKKGCNLIISHHPLLFHPLKRIDVNNDYNSILTEMLIKNDVTLYSAHTNLDYTKEGVSFILAKTLNLSNINFLSNLKANQYKLTVFAPVDKVEKVAEAAFAAGGGIIGEYSKTSFRTEGMGTFLGNENTNPSVGSKGTFQRVNEVKLEIIVNSWLLNKVIKAVNEAHPYEEAAYDIIPLENLNVNYGAGAIGQLTEPMTDKEFINYVSDKLKAPFLRYAKGKGSQIKKVAVCGGSGIEYLNTAISTGADAYITADIKYHSFQDAMGKILLIDAGHYETEIHSLTEVKKRLDNILKSQKIKVFKYSGSTNPIIFYNNQGAEQIV